MHQTVPKTKSHAGTSSYGDFYQHDSGVRDCRHPKGARSSMSMKDNSFKKDDDFIKERDQFIAWFAENAELLAHRDSKNGTSYGRNEDAWSELYIALHNRYGNPTNKMRGYWLDQDLSLLTIYLKDAFNNVLKDLGKKDKNGGRDREKSPLDPFDDEIAAPNFGQDDEPLSNFFTEEMWASVRKCIRTHYKGPHLALFIRIINFWQNGIDKPEVLCNHLGLKETDYAARRRTIKSILENNPDEWLDDSGSYKKDPQS